MEERLNNMEDFVTLDQAKKLKELGFQEKCFAYFLYDDEVEIGTYMKDYNYIVGLDYISAPTLYQTQKWLREIEKTEVIVNRIDEGIYDFTIYGKIVDVTTESRFDTYEEALSKGIDKALELILR